MPMYSSSAWKPVRASAVPATAPPAAPVPAAAVVTSAEGAGGGVEGVGTVVDDGGGPATSVSVSGVTLSGVQLRCNGMAPAVDVVMMVPGVITTGPVPDRVNV